MPRNEYDRPHDNPIPRKDIHIIDYLLPSLKANNRGEKEGATLHNNDLG